MTTPEFPIPVNDLDAGGKAFDFPVRRAWMQGVLEGHEATAGTTDGRIAVRASKSGADVVVHGALEAELTLPCARCLEPFPFRVQSDLSVLYVPASAKREAAGADDENELSLDEPDMMTFHGDTIALDDLIKDELLLEVPMIPLCSEECPGMSAGLPNSSQGRGDEANADGANPDASDSSDPTDPRLLPLMRFRGRVGVAKK